jgi:hypothetical protein
MKSDDKKAPAIVKRDTTVNWNKADNYIPNVGTIIIMDNEDGSVQLKFGDGKTQLRDLPNLVDRSTVQDTTLKL